MRLSKGLLAILVLTLCQSMAAAQTDAKTLHEQVDSITQDAISGDRSPTPLEQYRHAESLYRAKEWASATEALRDFISRFPADRHAVPARFYLGEASIQVRQYAQARASYRAFLDQLGERPHPDSAKALFRIGETSFQIRETTQAAAALNEFRRRYPDHALITYALPYLADLAMARGDFEESIQIADRQLSLGGRPPSASHLIIARAYQAMGQPEAARSACQAIASDASAEFDVRAKARLIVAETYRQQSRWELAVRAFQRLAAMHPVLPVPRDLADPAATTRGASRFRPQALLGAAECYGRIGEAQLARQTLLALLIEFPDTEASQHATGQLQALAEMRRT